MHIGNDGTLTMTSWLPSRPSAITWPAPQSENQSRPSCQRGDSPNAIPSIRTVMDLQGMKCGVCDLRRPRFARLIAPGPRQLSSDAIGYDSSVRP